ncbi:hypothetical protein LTR22_005589 [Elasticomyces elasticus]|nr:hypothetical protein LTR22_005589 [Elasticomyces elasticus]KAK4921767.1 hypothetical protein LTR49_010875 [Elasticomyces elasticus]KAK5764157.1 hypothetical protein LTS12_005606 [Elasticomyces elasticus]
MPVEPIAKTFEDRDVYCYPHASENALMSHVKPPVYTDVADATASRHQTRSHNASAREGDIDGLATLPSYGPADETYGPSSTVMFTRSIGPSEYTDQPGTPQPKHPEKSLRPLRDQDCLLPLRRSADDYLACLWNFTHPVFPVLHKPIFVAQYDRLWHADVADSSSEDSYDERTFLAILNIIFALGSRSSSTIPAEESDSAANEFWDRSRRLFTYDILDRPSLSIVQLLLLSGVYLQSSQSASACWNTVGLAIRVAQSIGLHTESDGGIQSGIRRKRIQLQTKLKVWHTLSAMSFGRPVMITHASKVPLPIAVDDEYKYVKLLSLRPLLRRSIRNQGSVTSAVIVTVDSTLDTHIIRQCCEECLDTAFDLIETIHDNLTTPYRSAGWHTVYFIVSAVTVVLACYRIPYMLAAARSERSQQCWQKWVVVLEYHARSISTASRAITVLQSMKQHMTDRSTRNGVTTQDGLSQGLIDGHGASDMLGNGDHATVAEIPEFDIDNISEAWLNQCIADLDWPPETPR